VVLRTRLIVGLVSVATAATMALSPGSAQAVSPAEVAAPAPCVGQTAAETALLAGSCGQFESLTFESGKTPTREVHVALTGNDTTGTGSAASPYRTLLKGVSSATPGTAVRIHAGTYGGVTIVNNVFGSATAPIWIGGVAGEARPVITGMLLLQKFHHVVVHDVEIAFTGGHGLQITDNADRTNPWAAFAIVVRDSKFHDLLASGVACIKMAGVNDFWIYDNEFANCSTGGQQIDMVGCHTGRILWNTMTSATASLQNLMIKGGSKNITVRGNRFTDTSNTSDTGIWLGGGGTGGAFFRPPLSDPEPNYQASGISIVANLFLGGWRSAVRHSGDVNTRVTHNTIVNPRDFVIRLLQEDSEEADGGVTYPLVQTQGGLWQANVIYFDSDKLFDMPNGQPEYVNIGAGGLPATFTWNQNLWYAWNNTAESVPTNLPSTQTGALFVDPQFVGSGADPYALKSTSPARYAAVNIPDYFNPTTAINGDLVKQCYPSPADALRSSMGAYASH